MGDVRLDFTVIWDHSWMWLVCRWRRQVVSGG